MARAATRLASLLAATVQTACSRPLDMTTRKAAVKQKKRKKSNARVIYTDTDELDDSADETGGKEQNHWDSKYLRRCAVC
jgi:hypothetical protein